MARKRKPKAQPEAFNAPRIVKYVGNRASRELHLMAWAGGSCQVEEIVEREEFEDFEATIAAGFTGCGHCCKAFGQGEAPAADGD